MWEDLTRDKVHFVVIGGVAAITHGSTRDTHDLDICYDPAPDNTARLGRILNAWNARLRLRDGSGADLPFTIDEQTFRDSPVMTLQTDLGWIDLMNQVTGIGDYRACLAASEEVRVGPDRLRVLTLDALIKSKRAAGRRPDLEHLIELEALRVLKRR
jgi:predicted nucleotidyltransferase